MHGVLNLLKPPGMSSHDAVACARRALHEKRIGHTGTLDPAAAGVLPLCVGQATRLVEWLQEGTKEYIAEAVFGFATDSGDLLGEVIARADASGLQQADIEACLPRFTGTIKQVPPLHSAVKVDGVRLYELARSGQSAEIPEREVTISQLRITGFTPGAEPRAMLHMQCSGGTYVRSLVRDLALAAGSVATMSFLVRSRSGFFGLDDAIAVEELSPEALTPLPEVLSWLVDATVCHDNWSHQFWQGKTVTVAAMQSELAPGALMGADGSYAQRLLVHNEAASVFAVCSPVFAESSVEPQHYCAEKVFNLQV